MKNTLLAKRYATAFLNLYGTQLAFEDIEHVRELSVFLKNNKRLLFLLQISLISETEKLAGIREVCIRFGLPDYFMQVAKLLIAHRRVSLLPAVLVSLDEQFYALRNVKRFVVASGCELEDNERTMVERFLQQRVGGSVVCTYQVDKALIAGIRVHGANYLWERSIAKQLRTMGVALSR